MEDVSEPVVNFINILWADLAPLFFLKRIQNQTVIREKLCKTLLYTKFAHKILIIMTPEGRSVDFRAENLALSEDLFEWDADAD